MRTAWIFFIAGAAACTATAEHSEYTGPSTEVRVPDSGAPSDAGADGPTADFDAGPCSDCEYFPADCSRDVFCPNGPFDPNSESSLDLRTTINAIRGRSATDVWAAGAVGGLAHFDGTSWTRSDPATQQTMRALWLPPGAEVAFGELTQFFVRGVDAPDGGAPPSSGGWTVHAATFAPGQEPPDGVFAGAWAVPGAEWLWCASKGPNGGLWRLRQLTSGGFEGAMGIPASVCRTVGCSHIRSIHGATVSELWAVGAGGATVRIKDAEGATPTAKAFNSQTMNALNGVWQATASDAWSVGARGTIRHYTGDPLLWEIVSNVPTSVNLNAIWGFSSSDIWAVGDSGVVLHYDGASWSRVKVAGLGSDRPNLTTVWGPAPGHVWIGGQGVVLSLGGTP